jgi:glycosyl transferase family 87
MGAGRRAGWERWAVGIVGAGLVAAIVVPAAAGVGPVVVAIVAVVLAATLPWFVRRLPERIDGVARRRPLLSLVWGLLALVALLQVGRLSAFMADPARKWGSTFPDPISTGHVCAAAYVHAAELSRSGEPNLYDAKFYPAYAMTTSSAPAGGSSSVSGLGPYLQDPYEYPPPFLLLPRAALALTNDFMAMRTAWFVGQALLLFAAALALASWAGGREGWVAGFLTPALLASLPTMLDLQFGQVHLTVVAAALLAMVAFERQRPALGGLLLGFAVVTKLFPALLLVWLLARRDRRAVLWTLAGTAAFTAAALAVLGSAPFVAFVSYQLPRIASGDAFSFFLRDPFFISRNFSVAGVVFKLRELGVAGMTQGVASTIGWIFTALLLWFAWRSPERAATRGERLRLWLALLSLGALRSPLAPSAYVTASTLWLLAWLGGMVRRPIGGIALFVVWIAVAGLPPMKGSVEMVTGLVCQAVTVGVSLWVVLRRPRPASAVQ